MSALTCLMYQVDLAFDLMLQCWLRRDCFILGLQNLVGVSPHIFNAVERARFFVEDVNDDVAIIQEYPSAGCCAFDFSPMLEDLSNFTLDSFRDGVDLAF